MAFSVIVPAPARADPADDPCSLAVVLFCRLLPTMPDLDHDIDLTQQPPGDDPAAVMPDPPLADICPRGCI